MTANTPTATELRNLTPETLRFLLEQDFRTMWDSLASDPDTNVRGNFTFGREAVGLMELAARVCAGDPTGKALTDLSAELERIEPRYFTPLPAPAQGTGSEFTLPSVPANGAAVDQLISAIFDLIRNGQAHQRQQIMVETTDGKTFGISLTGAGYGRSLASRTAGGRPAEHLALLVDEEDNIFVVVCPEILFLDLQEAITASGIFHRGLTFAYLNRPRRQGSNQYAYSAPAIHQALVAGGHNAFQRPAPTQQTASPQGDGAGVESGSAELPAGSSVPRVARREFTNGLAVGLLVGGFLVEVLRRFR